MENKDIYLKKEEKETLERFVKSGVRSARLIARARVILLLDRTGKKDHTRIKRVGEYTGLSRQAVYNIRNDYLNSASIEDFLTRKKRETPPVAPKITGKEEAYIIAMACTEPPKGRVRWTMRLLADRVELDNIGKVSKSTIQRVLKKRNISLT